MKCSIINMENNISFCGLDCSKCEAYLAHKENWNIEKRNEVAKVWAKRYNHPDLTGTDMACEGCRSKGKLFMHCTQCKIRIKNLK